MKRQQIPKSIKKKKAPEYDSNRKLQIHHKLPTDTEEFTFAHRMHTVEDQLAENSKLDPEIAQQTQQRLDNMSLFRFPQADDNVSSIRHPNPFDDDDLNLPKKQSVEEQLAARSKLDPEIAQHTQQQLSNAKLISIIHPNPFDDDINLPKQFVDDQLAEGSKLDLGIADHTQHQLDNVPLRKIRRRVARQKRE